MSGTGEKKTNHGFGSKLQGLSKILDSTEAAAKIEDNKTNTPTENTNTSTGENTTGSNVVVLSEKDLKDVIDKKAEARVAKVKEGLRKKKKNVERNSVHAEAGLHKKMKVKLAQSDITFYELIDTIFEMLLEDQELFKKVKLKITENQTKELE